MFGAVISNNGTDWTGIGTLLIGLAAIMTVVSAPLHRKLNRVDKAVNNVPNGVKPLTDRVDEGFTKMKEDADAMEKRLNTKLDTHIKDDGAYSARIDAKMQKVGDFFNIDLTD